MPTSRPEAEAPPAEHPAVGASLPDGELLARAVARVLDPAGGGRGITLTNRAVHVHASTFGAEVVTCRFPDGSERRLFCKYEAGPDHPAYGHRRGLAYEAEVCGRVLQPLRLSAPRHYGQYADPRSGRVCLVFECIEAGERLTKSRHPEAMTRAARWIGRFHALNQPRVAVGELSFLIRYDAAYYLGWARRTLRFAGRLDGARSWLSLLCRRFEELVDVLVDGPATVVHGEYYPKNILIHDGVIYPVDWESSAIGAGEIDLVALTEGWPVDVVAACETEYGTARWPDGRPLDFERRLDAARLYVMFRWLGDRPEWTGHERLRPRIEALRVLGERLGVL